MTFMDVLKNDNTDDEWNILKEASVKSELFSRIDGKETYGRWTKKTIGTWLSQDGFNKDDAKTAIDKALTKWKSSNDEDSMLEFTAAKWARYNQEPDKKLTLPTWARQWKMGQTSLGIQEPHMNPKSPKVSDLSLQIDAIKQVKSSANAPVLDVLIDILSNTISDKDEQPPAQKEIGGKVVEDENTRQEKKRISPAHRRISERLVEIIEVLFLNETPTPDMKARAFRVTNSFDTDFLLELKEFYDGKNKRYSSALFDIFYRKGQGILKELNGWEVFLKYLETQGKRIPNKSTLEAMLEAANIQYKGKVGSKDLASRSKKLGLNPKAWRVKQYVMENEVEDKKLKNKYIKVIQNKISSLLEENKEWDKAIGKFYISEDKIYGLTNHHKTAETKAKKRNKDVDEIFGKLVKRDFHDILSAFESIEEYDDVLEKLGIDLYDDVEKARKIKDNIANQLEDIESIMESYNSKKETLAEKDRLGAKTQRSRWKDSKEQPISDTLIPYYENIIARTNANLEKFSKTLEKLREEIELADKPEIDLGITIVGDMDNFLGNLLGEAEESKTEEKKKKRLARLEKKYEELIKRVNGAKNAVKILEDIQAGKSTSGKRKVIVSKIKEQIENMSSGLDELKDKDIAELKDIITSDIELRTNRLKQLKERSQNLDWEPDTQDDMSYLEILSLLDSGEEDVQLGWIPAEIADDIEEYDSKIKAIEMPTIVIEDYNKTDFPLEDKEKPDKVWDYNELKEELNVLRTDRRNYRTKILDVKNARMEHDKRLGKLGGKGTYAFTAKEKASLKNQTMAIEKLNKYFGELRSKMEKVNKDIQFYETRKKNILSKFIKENPDKTSELKEKADSTLQKIIQAYQTELSNRQKNYYTPILDKIKTLEEAE